MKRRIVTVEVVGLVSLASLAALVALVGLVVVGCGIRAVGSFVSGDAGGEVDAADGGYLADGAVSDAGADAPITCDASFDDDPANCGRCGRSCLGGTCEAGACSIVTVADNEPSPQGLAVDGTNVYWTNTGGSGDVEKCPLSSCTNGGTVLASGLSSPNAVLSAGGHAYWTNFGSSTLQRCAVGGCNETATTVATMTPASSGFGRLAADDTTLFFTDGGNGKVHACPLTGCPGGPAVLATAQPNPWGIAVDDTRVYWVNDNVGTGSVESCPKTGCGGSNALRITLASAQSSPRTIAIDATHVYWATQADGTVKRCAKTGCNDQPQTLASALLNPHGVAVDEAFVYFTERGTANAIKKVPKAGGGTILVADAQSSPFNVVVDDKAIYWTNWVLSGSIRKVAK